MSLRTVASVDRVLVRHVELGLGVAARVLGSSGTLAPSQLNGATAGAVLRVGYRTALGPVDATLGPQLECLVRAVIVRVDGAEVFRLPAFVGLVGLEVSLAPASAP
jgi:hypothetical protein